ncbi:unnamed protein product [Lupinus luteus]|uniref:Uncharacterized protein n=1 Tax=Lupinus luteus TaxID=3873 RepID=A0AAV1WFU2_LUPLU
MTFLTEISIRGGKGWDESKLHSHIPSKKMRKPSNVVAEANGFPSFLPKEVERIQDPFARKLALRIQRLPVPVRFSENPIMSSCVKPLMQGKESPVVLLHGFDRYSKYARNKVEKLVLIDASVYAEGTGNLATLPTAVAYAGVNLLKSIPLRLYVNYLNASTKESFNTTLDWTNVRNMWYVTLSNTCHALLDTSGQHDRAPCAWLIIGLQTYLLQKMSFLCPIFLVYVITLQES